MEITEILGGDFVEGIKYKDKKREVVESLSLNGIFVEIGSIPNSEFLGDLIKKNEYNEIVVDHAHQTTSCRGIWAAGDVTDLPYRQNIISSSDGVKAILSIKNYLNGNNK